MKKVEPSSGAANDSARIRRRCQVENLARHEHEFGACLPAVVRRIMSDMKTVTMRVLNRKTASILDALERGETFELKRNGRAVGYLTQTPPRAEGKPDWKSHFAWLRKQSKKRGEGLLATFEKDRRRLRAREEALGNLG